MGIEGSFSGIKRPEREADFSSPFNADVKPPLTHTFSCRGAEVIKHRSSTGITLTLLSTDIQLNRIAGQSIVFLF
jgi:hypothetical protein